MNIRDHILAGHYPVDDKGRALVIVGGQGRKGWRATIIATDAPDGIIGFGPASTRAWDVRGVDVKGHGDGDLQPPPLRKVRVTIWGAFQRGKLIQFATEREALFASYRSDSSSDIHCVELTGEYEEPWS